MSTELKAYTILQETTSTNLAMVSEFIHVANQLFTAYETYWDESTSKEISQAMFALGYIAHANQVTFDLDKLIHLLANAMDER